MKWHTAKSKAFKANKILCFPFFRKRRNALYYYSQVITPFMARSSFTNDVSSQSLCFQSGNNTDLTKNYNFCSDDE